MARSCFRRRHHSGRAAKIEVGAGSVFTQCCGNVEAVSGIAAVVMKLDPAWRRWDRELIEECRLPRWARAIMQREIGALPAQYGDHCDDRSNTDPAGDQ